MFSLKFPITSFGLIPQSNHSPKIASLQLLIFSKFNYTSHLKPKWFLPCLFNWHSCSLLCAIGSLETLFFLDS
ncbi:hypothetical protein ACE6H2_023508 [Prunus campanulata]